MSGVGEEGDWARVGVVVGEKNVVAVELVGSCELGKKILGFGVGLMIADRADLVELLLRVRVNLPGPDTFGVFREFATRHGDFALAGVAVLCQLDSDGVVRSCRIAAAGVAPTPHRLHSVEEMLVGQRLADEVLREAEQLAHNEVDPTGDIHASAAYRQRLTGALVKRALTEVRAQQEVSHA